MARNCTLGLATGLVRQSARDKREQEKETTTRGPHAHALALALVLVLFREIGFATKSSLELN